MRINYVSHDWAGSLTTRKKTDYIILHHRAGNGTVESIHSEHLRQDYVGIGYNFYIRKNGNIYTGRPIDKVGAHATGYNSISVGVCFEGNFQSVDTVMSKEQLRSGKELVKYLLRIYPGAQIRKHSDVGSTVCPGQYFPFLEISAGANAEESDIGEITERLGTYGLVEDKPGLVAEVNKDPNGRLYWFARKSLEYISKLPYDKRRTVKEYKSINDIVWELNYRGLVEDSNGFLEEVAAKPNGRLYWLARKVTTFIRNRI